MMLAMLRTIPIPLLVLLVGGCTSRVELSGVSFEPPAGAKRLEPTPSRAAQYELNPDVRLVFYHFGDRGAGSVEANIERWIDQFEQPDGAPSRDRADIRTMERGGLSVRRIDLSGTYVAETQPGSGERLHEPDYRLLAAVVETEAGPFYLKLVGPADVIGGEVGTFDAMLDSLAAAPVIVSEAAEHQ